MVGEKGKQITIAKNAEKLVKQFVKCPACQKKFLGDVNDNTPWKDLSCPNCDYWVEVKTLSRDCPPFNYLLKCGNLSTNLLLTNIKICIVLRDDPKKINKNNIRIFLLNRFLRDNDIIFHNGSLICIKMSDFTEIDISSDTMGKE